MSDAVPLLDGFVGSLRLGDPISLSLLPPNSNPTIMANNFSNLDIVGVIQ